MRASLALKQSNSDLIERLILSAFSPGDDVTCASDQQGLLGTIISRPPDILIYNRFFPGNMPALEAMKAVKRSSPRTRIIFLVGQLDEKAWADCAAARMMGICDVICWEKGIIRQGSQLLSAVQNMIVTPRSDADNDSLDQMLESVLGVRIRKPRVYVYGEIDRKLPPGIKKVDIPNDADLIVAAGDPEEAVRFFASLNCNVPIVMVSDFDDVEVKSLVKSNVAAIRPEMLDDFLKEFFFPGDGSAPSSTLVKEVVQAAKTGGNVKEKFVGLLKKWAGWKSRFGKVFERVVEHSQSDREIPVTETIKSSPLDLDQGKKPFGDGPEYRPQDRRVEAPEEARRGPSVDTDTLPEGFVALGRINGVPSSVTFETVQQVVAAKPRVVLVSGTMWIKDLRREKSLVAVPIIVVGDEDPSLCCIAGADECVSTLDSQTIDLILARVARMRDTWAQAETDGLTGCYNRRFLDSYLAEERRPVSILMCDLDHFKKVNDTYGHAGGDEVLRQLGAFLRGIVRETDVVARYGGEEFVVVLPGAPIEMAVHVAEKICSGWRERPIDTDGSLVYNTVSIGVAAQIKDADAACYTAKNSGRDRVVRFGQQSEKEEPAVEPVPNGPVEGGETAEPVIFENLLHDVTETEAVHDGKRTDRLRMGFRKDRRLQNIESLVNDLAGKVVAVWNFDNYKKHESCLDVVHSLRGKVMLVEYDFTNPALDRVFKISTPTVDNMKGKGVKDVGAGLLTLGPSAKPEHVDKLIRNGGRVAKAHYLPAGNALGVTSRAQRYAPMSVYKGVLNRLRAAYETLIIDAEVSLEMPTTVAALNVADIVLVPVRSDDDAKRYESYKKAIAGEMVFCRAN